jgi:hypothetical protein
VHCLRSLSRLREWTIDADDGQIHAPNLFIQGKTNVNNDCDSAENGGTPVIKSIAIHIADWTVAHFNALSIIFV